MTQRLEIQWNLSVFEDKVFSSKNIGLSNMKSDCPIDQTTRNFKEFCYLSFACLGAKYIGLSDITSDCLTWDEKILLQRPHFRGSINTPHLTIF